jgi:hypothetical protein
VNDTKVKLTVMQACLSLFLFFPVALVLCIWSWTVLWNDWVEPITHFRMTYAFATGFGTFYAYYRVNKHVSDEEMAKIAREWPTVWVKYFITYPGLVGVSWLIRHFWMGVT